MKKPIKAVTNSRQSRRDTAYHAFIDQLFAGKIKPGSMVSQRELCELLDIPITPMREALKGLEAENFVELIPQRGIRILGIEEEFINDAFRLRKIIEIEGLRAFFKNGDIENLTDLCKRTKAASQGEHERDYSNLARLNKYTDLDHEMHLHFIGALENEIVNDLMRPLLGKLRLSRLIFRLHNYHYERAFKEHLGILDNVIAGDEEAAVTAMADHLQGSWQRLLAVT